MFDKNSKMDAEKKALLQEKLRAAFASNDQPAAPTKEESSDGEDADHASVPACDDAAVQQGAELLREFAGNEDVEVTNLRLFSISDFDLEQLTVCTCLSFRKNLIHELSPLPLALARRLLELDFFDNKIRKLRDFFVSAMVRAEEGGSLTKQMVPSAFSSIVKVDLSYNQIHKICGLEALGGTLKELYLVENKIKVIEGLESLVHLEVLELGGNRIREIGPGLATLTSLRFLWLGKNKIGQIGDALHNLGKLELLSLQANRLTAILPGEFSEKANPLLREVYLSENGISAIENIPVHTLTLLDFSFNPIKTINEAVMCATNFPLLAEFWLTDGQVDSWAEVDKFKCFDGTLRTIYLERNPIEQDKRYRDKVYLSLPFVTQIDSWPVVNKDNLEADRMIERRGDKIAAA